MRNLLQIVQDICNEMALPVPNAVVSSGDKQVLQFLALANREGKELSTRTGAIQGWPALRKLQTISIIAGTDNYAFPTDILRYIDATGWNSSSFWRLSGPQTPQEWQFLKNAQVVSTINYRYRIMANRVYFDPTPTDNSTATVEYYSKNWILDIDGSTTKERFSADTDTPILDDYIVELGIKWRFLRAKGFSYDEEKNAYEDAVELAMASSVTGRDLTLGRSPMPGPHLLDQWNFPDTGYGS